MTPADRSQTIAQIRTDLAGGVPVTVVSTSLIEAGIDFDFRAVFREIAGLDNIIQSGGRCNREGLQPVGDVFVFDTGAKLIRDLQIPVNIVKDLFTQFDDITSVACVAEYYRRLFRENDDLIQASTIDDGKRNLLNIPFRTYAQQFSFISDASVGVVIATCEAAKTLYESLRQGNRSVLRKLQKYTVSLRQYELESALSQGLLSDFGTGVFRLTNNQYYNKETGLNLDGSDDKII